MPLKSFTKIENYRGKVPKSPLEKICENLKMTEKSAQKVFIKNSPSEGMKAFLPPKERSWSKTLKPFKHT